VLRQLVGIGSIVGNQYLGHASNLGRGFGSSASVGTGYQNVNVATDLLRGGNGVQGSGSQSGIGVFSDNQDSHLDYLRLVLQFLDQFSHGLD
ncbi:hypothetical protein, partial [Klebsiella pneumoniae]|uniref:hypothetical protein n=1 Tax=Klebsiella pneumoniae TaxID=573 RepID=UPI003F75D825